MTQQLKIDTDGMSEVEYSEVKDESSLLSEKEFLSQLNEGQRQAASHINGPCLVIAGPGTGKTHMLTSRIVYLMKYKNVSPSNILAVTFTDKAAEEMEIRVDQGMELGYEEVELCTFHGLCDRILRERGFEIGIDPGYQIMSKSDQFAFLKQRIFSFSLNYFRPLGNPTKFIDFLSSYFSRLKDEDISVEQYRQWVESKLATLAQLTEEDQEDIYKHQELAKVYGEYQEVLMQNNKLDFNDLIFYTLKLLRERPSVLRDYQNQWTHIMIDEFQDTNFIQSQLMYTLARKHKNIMVVGDDDQSIYRFRGASVSNILQFESAFDDCKKVVLNENYRSHQNILDLSYTSIQKNNPDRLEAKENISKKLESKRDDIFLNPTIEVVKNTYGEEESKNIVSLILKNRSLGYAYKDMAILIRSSTSCEMITSTFDEFDIPYYVANKKGMFEESIVKDIMCAIRVVVNPYDDISLFRVLKMKYWNIAMEDILSYMNEQSKECNSLWSKLDQLENQKNIKQFFHELIEYSKEHSVLEVVYMFVEKCYFNISDEDNISEQNEQDIQLISKFLSLIKNFIDENKSDSIKDFLEYLDLIIETSDIPSSEVSLVDDDVVSILTMHSSKGLEFPVVFVPHLVSGRFPTRNRKEPFSIPSELIKEILPEGDYHVEEERRLFYVACTRAKDSLYLSYSESYNRASKRKRKPSIFINEVMEQSSNIIKFLENTNIEEISQDSAQDEISTSEKNKQINNNILKVSYSQLDTFKSCPKKYQYRYIYNIPQKPSAALSFGTTIHSTLNKFYDLVQKYQQSQNQMVIIDSLKEDLPPLNIETLHAMYEESWVPYGYDSKAHMNARKQRGAEMLKNYYETFKDFFGTPLYLEKSFNLILGKYRITGRFDRVDSVNNDSDTVEIFDYKTGKNRSQKEVDKDLQLSIYAMAAKDVYNKNVEKLSLYFLDENLKVETTRDEKQLEKAKQNIIETLDEMNLSKFEAKPDTVKCGFCDFKNICESAKL